MSNDDFELDESTTPFNPVTQDDGSVPYTVQFQADFSTLQRS